MQGASIQRALKPEEIRCGAGQLVNEADCFCGIEGMLILGRLHPDSIEGFCAGEYTRCPSYLAAKKIEEKGGDLRRILASMQDENRERRMRTELRDARLRRAQRLMVEDSPEGRRFRELLKVGEFERGAEVVDG
jgi:hypothetical protein